MPFPQSGQLVSNVMVGVGTGVVVGGLRESLIANDLEALALEEADTVFDLGFAVIVTESDSVSVISDVGVISGELVPVNVRDWDKVGVFVSAVNDSTEEIVMTRLFVAVSDAV